MMRAGGRRAELPLKKRFLLQKLHGSLDLDRNCPGVSISAGMGAEEDRGVKKKNSKNNANTTEDCKLEK